MKILFVSNMYPSKSKPYAGVFVKNQYDELLKQLAQEDILDFFYMERKFTGALGSFLKYVNASIKFFPFLLKRYDILHLHFFYPLIILVWAYKKVYPKTKVIVTFHGSDINLAVTTKNQRILAYFSKVIDVAIPVGKILSIEVAKKLKPKTITVLPVGVDGRIFKTITNQPKTYDFIWVGSFYSIKGIDVLIEAIKAIKGKALSFCFCGSGEYADELKALYPKHQVQVKENLTQMELAVLLNSSRYFVLMSRNEGFPTATIEAMYCGIPVLTSDIPQFKEQVRQGENGFLVPVNDPESLTKELIRLSELSEEKYSKLKQGALESFKEISLEEVCRKLLEIYKGQLC